MPADCTNPAHNWRECEGFRKGRTPCHQKAVDGTDPARCRMHIGTGKTKAAVRAAVARWGADMTTLDPGETLLRLMTVAYVRAEQHADELDRILTEHGWHEAFVGDTFVVTEDGDIRKVGEYAKQLAVWESTERKHAADLAVRAVAAGLKEREVRLLEQQAQVIVGAVEAALKAAGVTGDAYQEGRRAAGRHLQAVS